MELKQVRAMLDGKVHYDTLSRRPGSDEFIVRLGYFYTHGYDEGKLADAVKKAIPNARITDQWNKWKAFRGGDTTAMGSHFGVSFKILEEKPHEVTQQTKLTDLIAHPPVE
jgi:hypothetical protein